MEITKPTKKNYQYLEMALEWVLAESKSLRNLESDRSFSMNGSRNGINASISVGGSVSSSISGRPGAALLEIPLYMENTLSTVKIFQKLLRLC